MRRRPSAGKRCYQVVLTRCDPHVIASIDELQVQVVAHSMQAGTLLAGKQARRRLARYAMEGRVPEPVEKRLGVVEFPIPVVGRGDEHDGK
jgi:hypothetical protein